MCIWNLKKEKKTYVRIENFGFNGFFGFLDFVLGPGQCDDGWIQTANRTSRQPLNVEPSRLKNKPVNIKKKNFCFGVENGFLGIEV